MAMTKTLELLGHYGASRYRALNLPSAGAGDPGYGTNHPGARCDGCVGTDRAVNFTGGKFYRPSREGCQLIAGHFDPKVAKELKMLAVEEETTVQALLEEALQLLFLKKGKEAILRSGEQG